VNHGLIESVNATLTLSGPWQTTGTVSLTNSTANLAGNFSVNHLAAITRSDDSINIVGTLNNTGTTLILDAASGSWHLAGGGINGGTISNPDGASFTANSSTASKLDGVTLNTDLFLEGDSCVVALNGLTLNGILTLGAGAGDYRALEFDGSQTLDGSGQVVFASLTTGGTVQPTSGTLTIGPSITIRGHTGTVGNRTLPLINQGTISADTAGGTIYIRANPFTNNGAMQELNGGKVLINP